MESGMRPSYPPRPSPRRRFCCRSKQNRYRCKVVESAVPPRLLLVEDNAANREMLLRRLRREGFEVITAGDGAEAVAKAHAERPGLILMDMSMPVLDGWEATRKLKASLLMRHTPIIALTAHLLPTDLDRFRDAGCDDIQGKPVDFPRLLASIWALLGRGRPPSKWPPR